MVFKVNFFCSLLLRSMFNLQTLLLQLRRDPLNSREPVALQVEVIISKQYILMAVTGTRMPIDFYYMPASAPCRAVLLTAHLLDVELNLILTDLSKGQHLTAEFIKKNPRHSIPTIDDDGFILSESRAILGYLVDQYGKDDSLYPKDPKKRAIVNQRLYFDCGTLYQRFHNLYNFRLSLMTAQENPVVHCKLEEAFYILNKYLEKQTWVAGEDMTIADISLITTVSSAEIFGFELIKYKNVQKWIEYAKKTIPGYEEINQSGCLEYRRLYDISVVRADNTLAS